MKSCEEMVDSLLARRADYLSQKKAKQRAVVRISAASVCCALVVLSGVAIRQSGLLSAGQPGNSTPGGTPGSSEASHSEGSEISSSSQGGELPSVSTDSEIPSSSQGGGDASSPTISQEVKPGSIGGEPPQWTLPIDESENLWNKKCVSDSLISAFERSSEQDMLLRSDNVSVFPIYALCRWADPEFVWNEKRIEEYRTELSETADLCEKLRQLEKCGDSLKYGEALYQDGTPDGERWAKQFYDSQIEFFGSDLLAKYIEDGVFYLEKLQADIAATKKESEALWRDLDFAQDAFYRQAIQDASERLRERKIPCEQFPDSHYLILFATEEEFSALSPDEGSGWFFGLARTGSFGPEDCCEVE